MGAAPVGQVGGRMHSERWEQPGRLWEGAVLFFLQCPFPFVNFSPFAYLHLKLEDVKTLKMTLVP